MRIYMAGFYAGRGTDSTTSINFQISRTVQYPWVLESFHYYTEQMGHQIRRDGKKIFLDSGAFSMFTQKVAVDLKKYARFVINNADILEVASNLDHIGEGGEAQTYANQKQLEEWGAKVNPVHHARDRDEWLVRYLEEGYDYIFLGGMVPEGKPYLHEWLDHVWHHYLTNDDGTPKVKVHGFGLTAMELMTKYPWYSVDSTSWVMASRFGQIFFDLPRPNGTIDDFKLDLSERSPRMKDYQSWHYHSLPDVTKKEIRDRLAEVEAERPKNPEVEARIERATGIKQGYNIEALSNFYGWRDHYNITYFNRSQSRNVKTFKRVQQGLFA